MTELRYKLAVGETARRVHLARGDEAVCGGVALFAEITQDIYRPMIDQVTCENCLRAMGSEALDYRRKGPQFVIEGP